MSNLATRNSAEVRAVKQELARRLGNVELASKVTELAISEVGELHSYGVQKVDTTLRTAEHLVKSADYAGRLTDDKKKKVAKLTSDYLNDVIKITDDTAARLIDDMLRP